MESNAKSSRKSDRGHVNSLCAQSTYCFRVKSQRTAKRGICLKLGLIDSENPQWYKPFKRVCPFALLTINHVVLDWKAENPQVQALHHFHLFVDCVWLTCLTSLLVSCVDQWLCTYHQTASVRLCLQRVGL
jgi:hypothetical protein